MLQIFILNLVLHLELVVLYSYAYDKLHEKARDLQDVVNFERFLHVFSWVLARANVEANDLMINCYKPSQIEEKTESLDPDVEKDDPESVLKGCRILQVKDEEILDHRNAVKVDENLRHIVRSNDRLRKAKPIRQRPNNESVKFQLILVATKDVGRNYLFGR